MSTVVTPRRGTWHSLLYGRRDLTEYPGGKTRAWQLSLVIFAATICTFERFKFSPILGSIMAYFNMTKSDFANLLTLAAVCYVIAPLIGGPLMDRFGRKVVVVWSVFAWGGVSVWLAATTTVFWFSAAWVVSTLIMGLASPGLNALTRDYSPRMGRATAYGFFSICWGAGPYLALWFAALLLPYFSTWQEIFYCAAVVGFAAFLVLLPLMQDLSPQVRHQVVASAAQKAEVDERARQMTAEESQATLGRVAVILRQGRIWSLVIAIELWALTYMIISMYGPLFFQEAFGMGQEEAAMNISWFWIMWTVFVIFSGWLCDHLQTRKLVNLFGCCSAGTILLAIAVVSGRQVGFGTLMALWIALGVAAGFVYPAWVALYSENVEEISPYALATAFSLNAIMGDIGNIIKSFFALRIVEIWGWSALWAVAGICALLVPLCMIPATGAWLPHQWRQKAVPPLRR